MSDHDHDHDQEMLEAEELPQYELPPAQSGDDAPERHTGNFDALRRDLRECIRHYHKARNELDRDITDPDARVEFERAIADICEVVERL